MQLEKIKANLAKLLAGDSEELGRLARDIGHELPKKRLAVLNEFRATLVDSVTPPGRYIRNYLPEDGYIRGYLAALADVAAAFSAAILPEKQDEEDVIFLRDNGHKPVLLALLKLDRPAGPWCLAIQIMADWGPSVPYNRSCGLEDVKNKLTFLCQSEVVESFGERPNYRLTLRGERLAKQLLERPK